MADEVTCTVFTDNLYNGRTDNPCCNFSPQQAQNFLSGDPLFADPLFVHRTAAGQYATSSAASATRAYGTATFCAEWTPTCNIAGAFAPGFGSLAYNAGTDPSSSAFTSGWPQVQTDMRNYIYTDINGNARPGAGRGWDLGAMQRRRDF